MSPVWQLHVAAANGYLSVVKYLLDNHVAVGPCDKDDWQPIHAAACWGHVSHVTYGTGYWAADTRRRLLGTCESRDIWDRVLGSRYTPPPAGDM